MGRKDDERLDGKMEPGATFSKSESKPPLFLAWDDTYCIYTTPFTLRHRPTHSALQKLQYIYSWSH